ncbi:MAG: recombinase family protein [Oscillospiraceae bacterium]|nr:recombinase family protein [Oscillospiraceae bacterium]
MNAVYARQSIDKKDSLSIEGQIALCKRHAGEEALVFQDRGYSGKNTKRPAFRELMRAVESGKVRKIYVYRLDRFSRSIADFSRLWETLNQYGVEFHSVTEQFDTSSPIGRAMLNIVLVFAQLERETTSERVRDNYIHRVRLGVWPGGPAPYGFDLGKLTEAGRSVSTLVPNDKAEIVRKIFSEYDRPGASLRSVVRALEAEGVHGPKRETWDNVTVSRILRSPRYVRADANVYWYGLALGLLPQQEAEAFDGVHACNILGRRGRGQKLSGGVLTLANHEGLVSSELWLRVQDKMSGNPQLPRARAGTHSWLSGLMKCAKCGYAVKINYSKSENRRYLLCSGRSNLSACDASIRTDLRQLEEIVALRIGELLASVPPERGFDGQGAEFAAVLETEQKIDRLLGALAEGSEVSAGYILKQVEALHRERERLLSSGTPRHSAPLRLDFDAVGFEEKKLIAAELIDRVLLDGEDANVIWKF